MPKKISFKKLQKTTQNPTVSPSGNDSSGRAGPPSSLKEIENLSISFIKGEKDFSLKTLSKNKEFIQNPKILEIDSYSKIENTNVNAKDKFSNEDDPFYELDEARSNTSQDSVLFAEKNVKPSIQVSSRITAKLMSNKSLKQPKNTR